MIRSLAILGALTLATASNTVFAQQAAPPQQQQAQQGPVHVDLKPTQASWTKVCGHDQVANKDICYTTRDFGQAAGELIAPHIDCDERSGCHCRIGTDSRIHRTGYGVHQLR